MLIGQKQSRTTTVLLIGGKSAQSRPALLYSCPESFLPSRPLIAHSALSPPSRPLVHHVLFLHALSTQSENTYIMPYWMLAHYSFCS